MVTIKITTTKIATTGEYLITPAIMVDFKSKDGVEFTAAWLKWALVIATRRDRK